MTVKELLQKYWAEIALLVIILFGLALRLYQLDFQCLNVDEFTTYNIANHSASYIVNYAWQIGDNINGMQLGGDYNPPTYYLLVHFSMQLLGGFSRFAVRIPAVIFGTVSIPMVYLVGKELRNKTLGLLTATLISFMFPFYIYSQDARPYSLVMLGFLGFTYFFINAYRGEKNDWNILGLSLCAALCFYSHYYSLVPIGLAVLILLWKRTATGICTVITTTIFMIPFLTLFNFRQVITRMSPEMMGIGRYTMFRYTAQVLNELLCWSWLILIPLFFYSIKRYWKEEPLLKVLGFIAVGAILIGIPLTQLITITPRYPLLVAPLLVLVAIYPISELIDKQSSTMKKITIFVGFTFLILTFNIGSIWSWNEFNYCFAMSGTGAAIPT